MERAPLVFHLFNQCLAECSFSSKLLEEYYLYSTILLCQPLPFSLLPLETERTLINERLLPGITKVLRVAQNFPQIDIEPEADYARTYDWCSSVFLYENGPLGAKNGTINLLKELPKPAAPSEADFHKLRLEFVTRVFSGYMNDELSQEIDPDLINENEFLHHPEAA